MADDAPDHAGQLHHLELYAADLDAALPFWEWFLGELGYEEKNDWDGGRSWINGPTYVVLVQAGNTEHPFDRDAAGLNHVAFHARSQAHVDEITDGIREREDVELLFPERHPRAGGHYALYAEGPEGVKVEVVAPDDEE
jgi:catechol 2,3-dioxygenase-like lactoylglutathione lyase family enzyme